MHLHEIGFYHVTDREKVAKRVIDELESLGKNPESFLYRGFVCNGDVLKRVLKTGRDRCSEEQMDHARRLVASEPCGDLALEDALAEKHPDLIFLYDSRDISGCADRALTDTFLRGNDYFGAISFYDPHGLEMLPPRDPEQGKYRFTGRPLDLLRGVFKFHVFRPARVS